MPDGDLAPRYNVAPTQPIVAVRLADDGREAVLLRWGLIPHWSNEPGHPLNINARAETIATKPMFRDAFKRHRCLIPANGFYEWQQTGSKRKQPYNIQLKGGRPFAFAGLWDRWTKGSEPIESCTIITADANELVRPLHDRMPVFLHEADYETWLDPESDQQELESLLVSYPPEEMESYPVSLAVNNFRNDSPECVEPIGSQGSLY